VRLGGQKAFQCRGGELARAHRAEPVPPLPCVDLEEAIGVLRAPRVADGPGSSKKKWIIGGSIAAGVLLVGGVSSALGAGRGADVPAATVTVTAAPAPSETPAVEAASEGTSPPVVAEEQADPVAFIAQSNGHLDDMLKDLGDIEVTDAEQGFRRLLSNDAELNFNLGQLRALDVPESVKEGWATSLTALETQLVARGDAISTEDGATVLGAVNRVRAQLEASRSVANTAT